MAQSREKSIHINYPYHAPQVGDHVFQGVENLGGASPRFHHPLGTDPDPKVQATLGETCKTRSGGRSPTAPIWEQNEDENLEGDRTIETIITPLWRMIQIKAV